ncbi:hypothetical protein M6B38_413570 [Iris pallida]|uniref:Uncharacterized protein n=1 Tax=Iris pallida TaxID=29817 RepID=A0AAX6FLE0_IRIPA|nr:hypothetical protein M6B38_413570 [Iris pallida]
MKITNQKKEAHQAIAWRSTLEEWYCSEGRATLEGTTVFSSVAQRSDGGDERCRQMGTTRRCHQLRCSLLGIQGGSVSAQIWRQGLTSQDGDDQDRWLDPFDSGQFRELRI